MALAPRPAADLPVAPPTAPAVDRRRVLGFIALATALSTLLSLPFAVGLLPASAVALVVPVAQLSPLLAALVVRERGTRIRDAFALTVPSWSRLAVVSVLAVAAFALVPLGRTLLGLALGVPVAGDAGLLLPLLAAVPAVLVLQSVFAIGEELGWRGWLQTELRPLGFWAGALLTGGAWALWHLPVVLALGLDGRELVTYLGTIIAVAPLLAALRDGSGTVWAAVLGHGLLNSLRVALEQNLLGEAGAAAGWMLDGASWLLWMLWVLAAVAVRRLLPGRPPGHRA